MYSVKVNASPLVYKYFSRNHLIHFMKPKAQQQGNIDSISKSLIATDGPIGQLQDSLTDNLIWVRVIVAACPGSDQV